MQGKKDNRIILIPVIIVFVFLFSIIGYHQLMGDKFSLPGAIYSTLFYFILNDINPSVATENGFLLAARYLAAFTLGFGIYSLLYKHLHYQYTRLKIKYKYRNHIVVFSIKMVGANFLSDLLANKYKVILVEEQSEDPLFDKVEKDGVIVIKAEEHGAKLFDTLQLSHAGACIVAFDDDSKNIELSLKVISYLRTRGHKHMVRVLTHIGSSNNLEVIKDYIDISNADENFEFEIFNIYSAAAKKIYDHFAPHRYFDFANPVDNAIAVVGYNQAAEDFLVENIILSHYKDCTNIKIYLVDKDADVHLHEFAYKYPFYREFADIVPVRLLNGRFFANFNWSKELIEKLSKTKAAYFFGNDGAEVISLSARFRQFLSGQVPNYLAAPGVICFPEDTGIMNLLDVERENAEKLSVMLKHQMNLHFVNMISDTCTSSRLLEESEYIDLLSRVINYYYAVKYEFEYTLQDKWQISAAAGLIKSIEEKFHELADKHVAMTEREVEQFVLQALADATAKTPDELRKSFGIKKSWDTLSYHKKSANRYAARHLAVKLKVMKELWAIPLSREGIMQTFPVIAPIEHKRWCAERMVVNYRYGALPADRAAKNIAKEVLKIHDQLVPYDKLSDTEREKDLDIFLLMPLLNLLKVEIKK